MKERLFSKSHLLLRVFLLVFIFALQTLFVRAEPAPTHWWKGNLHTHSLWSDGNDYPEMIINWYRQNGYDFLSLSDHNVTQAGQRWTGANTNRGGSVALERYIKRFGTNW